MLYCLSFSDSALVLVPVSENQTRAETAQTMANTENYMSVKKVANRQDSCIMSKQVWEGCEKIVWKCPDSCEKIVRQLWEGCEKVSRKLGESC